MSVTDLIHFDKDGVPIRYLWLRKLFLSLVIVLVATLSFGIGRLTGEGEKEKGIRIEYDASIDNKQSTINNKNQSATVLNAIENSISGGVVGSKNGTKYHFPYCPGAKQIKEENKISFQSAADAEASGYTLAGNCSKKP